MINSKFLLLIISLIFINSAYAQQDSSTTKSDIYEVELISGKIYIGPITNDDGREIEMMTRNMGKMIIPKTQIENISKTNENSQSFKEFNAGIYVGWLVFPGASFLWGKTYQSNKRIFEWQAGVALPTTVTGKLTLAHGKLDKYSGISIRVWPPTIGPQFKINRLTLSAEVGPDIDNGVMGILTVGFRR
ncbi:hypothetical protein OAP07_07340 [Bacteroidia bacterium]|jgi:hypothetical protein|nr:hypothetical protein [Bacteroidia bacterium]